MANKFTGITSAGVNVPVYDKEAHQALGNVYTKSEVDAELNTKQDNLSTEQLYNINNALTTSAGLMEESKLSINSNHITAYNGIPFSAQGGGGGGGATYEGVAPIIVDNTSNQISIDDSDYAKLEDTPNVFIGEYGVTTFAEITQALADKKAIFIVNCPMNQGSGKCQAHFAGTNVDGYFFENTEIAYTVSDPRIVRYWLKQTNTWSYSEIWSKSTDETVLWEGELTPTDKTVTLSENYTNFEKIAVEWAWNTSVGHRKISYFTSNQYNIGDSCASLAGTSTTDIYMGFFFGKLSNENQITLNLTKQIQIRTTSLSVINNQTLGAIYKVVGINRRQA